MKIYTAITGTLQHIERIKLYGMGIMISSHPKITLSYPYLSDVPLALDNGAFSAWQHGYPFDEYVFLKTMSKCREKKLSLDFTVCPDIVAAGLESLSFSLEWERRLRGCKLALVVQDGMEPHHLGSLVYSRFIYLFIGGTVQWKWLNAKKWIELAHKNNMKCHIGRCGNFNEIKTAYDLGADSCDSTNFVRNDNWKPVEEFLSSIGFTGVPANTKRQTEFNWPKSEDDHEVRKYA